MSRYHLRTLGRLSLHEESREGEAVMRDAKALAVLAYLADTPAGEGDRAHLARLLWPDRETSRARAGLRQALYYLRRKTPEDVTLVRRDEERVALDRSTLQVDLWTFQDAVSQEDWTTVLELHDGAFLGGYGVEGAEEFRHWREGRDTGLRAGLREACRALVSQGLDAGDPERAVLAARRWVEMNPLDEKAQTTLVRSLAAAGDRAGAYQAYESYRTLLLEELGESPGPSLTRVLDELRSIALEGESRREAAEGRTSAGERASAGEPGEWNPEAVRAAGSAETPTEGVSGGAPTGVRRGLAAAVLALAVILLVAAGWQMLAGDGGTKAGESPSAPEAEIFVEGRGPAGDPILQKIGWFGDSARLEEADDLPPGAVVSPGGDRVAVDVEDAEGMDLAVEDLRDGSRRVLVATDADEFPVAWSPDGQRIVYWAGRAGANGGYPRWYGVHHLDGSGEVPLGLAPPEYPRSRRLGDWSPLGPSILVVSDSAGNADLWTVRPDGTGARNLTADHGGWDGDPTYSPDGSRIAFSSDRSGNPDVWVVDGGGGTPRRITTSGAPDRAPVWLGTSTLGYFREREDGTEFHVVDLITGERRRIAELRAIPNRVFTRGSDSRRSWIASVELPSHLSRVSPGQWIRKSLTLRDSSGERLAAPGTYLRWSVTDTSLVGLEAGADWMRVRGPGEATLRVTAGGWRSDTIPLRSRGLRLVDLEPALREDWRRGVDGSRWLKLGDPSPTVVRAEGRFSRAFLNRGDENYHSGAVARRPVGTERGLTVEFWGRAPFTEPRYQDLRVGLVEELPASGARTWGARGAVIDFNLASDVPDSLRIALPGQIRTNAPSPPSVDDWHRYTLQVDTAGRLSLLVDGRMHWRSPETIDLERLDGTHLGLYGRSKGSRILHGPVRLWEGVRYRLP